MRSGGEMQKIGLLVLLVKNGILWIYLTKTEFLV